MTLNDLKSQMLAHGFKWQEGHEEFNSAHGIFYKRVTTKRPCINNNRDQLLVEVHIDPMTDRFLLEVSVTGEVTGTQRRWADLKFYGLTPEDVLSNEPEITAMLVRAWEALTP